MYSEVKSTILNGSIQIEGAMVVGMYAQKSNKGDISININIQSETLYQANKAECDADIKTFKEHAEGL